MVCRQRAKEVPHSKNKELIFGKSKMTCDAKHGETTFVDKFCSFKLLWRQACSANCWISGVLCFLVHAEAYTRCRLHEFWQHSMGLVGRFSVHDDGRRGWKMLKGWFGKPVMTPTCHWSTSFNSQFMIQLKWCRAIFFASKAKCRFELLSSHWIFCQLQAGQISCTECRIAMTSSYLPWSKVSATMVTLKETTC